MKYPHPWRRLGALACTAALTLTLIPAASASGGGYRQSGSLDMDKLSRQEIAALLADNSLELPGQLFEEEPSVTAPYRAGRVTDQALQAAVDRLNALRRIAGVPDVALESAGDLGGKLYGGAKAGDNDLTLVVMGNDEAFTITALFDNLGKGASGAAVQNMNIMLGLEETAGLV